MLEDDIMGRALVGIEVGPADGGDGVDDGFYDDGAVE